MEQSEGSTNHEQEQADSHPNEQTTQGGVTETGKHEGSSKIEEDLRQKAHREGGEESDEEEKEAKRRKFGNRLLQEKEKVWEHNAWDDVEWNEEQLGHAKRVVEEQGKNPVPPELKERYEMEAGTFWDGFYNLHENRFFKDRNWLFTEFPELRADAKERTDSSQFRVLEVGCGVGNTVFPLFKSNTDRGFFVYACDISTTAIDILKAHELYDPARCMGFVHDVSSTDPLPIPAESLDLVIMIFVLSAIQPAKFTTVIQNLSKVLKPGGLILFRDYGRYDMAQLRFKKNRLLEDNFYVRGDGTRVYFFTKEEMDTYFTEAGLECLENGYDRRLLVNRKRELQMYRVWLQCKYWKPAAGEGKSGKNAGKVAESSGDHKGKEME